MHSASARLVAVSKDYPQIDWKPRRGTRGAAGSKPATMKVLDGSFALPHCYCSSRGRTSARVSPVAQAKGVHGARTADSDCNVDFKSLDLLELMMP